MSFPLPQDFTVRMQEMLGDEYEDFLQSYENTNYQALRLNLLKGTSEDFFDVADFALELLPVPWASDGYYYPEKIRPGKHPYHEAGAYYIQEPSAMMPAALLDAQPGERILDLCAAPGGKSTQIASAMQQQGLLVSNEIHPARAKILSENMERMGVRNAIVTNESPQNLAPRFPSYFDRIMVDAPCSGEGMFRKNEEAVSQWSLENVQICADRQDMILDCADMMLRPGGTMVYSTCTFATLENEGSISRFLQRHPNYEVLEQKRLWPHKVEGEGHFVAVLKKTGDNDVRVSTVTPGNYDFYLRYDKIKVNSDSPKKKGKKGNTTIDDLAPLQDFLKEMSLIALSGKIELFGDQIYLLPFEAPDLAGIRVLRPGLHLGSITKNRFEPAHALALTLLPFEVSHWTLLRSSKPEDYRTACDYIGGQTFPTDAKKGWNLIYFDNYSLGWGKSAGGIMKNHYPKGLRKQL